MKFPFKFLLIIFFTFLPILTFSQYKCVPYFKYFITKAPTIPTATAKTFYLMTLTGKQPTGLDSPGLQSPDTSEPFRIHTLESGRNILSLQYLKYSNSTYIVYEGKFAISLNVSTKKFNFTSTQVSDTRNADFPIMKDAKNGLYYISYPLGSYFGGPHDLRLKDNGLVFVASSIESNEKNGERLYLLDEGIVLPTSFMVIPNFFDLYQKVYPNPSGDCCFELAAGLPIFEMNNPLTPYKKFDLGNYTTLRIPSGFETTLTFAVGTEDFYTASLIPLNVTFSTDENSFSDSSETEVPNEWYSYNPTYGTLTITSNAPQGAVFYMKLETERYGNYSIKLPEGTTSHAYRNGSKIFKISVEESSEWKDNLEMIKDNLLTLNWGENYQGVISNEMFKNIVSEYPKEGARKLYGFWYTGETDGTLDNSTIFKSNIVETEEGSYQFKLTDKATDVSGEATNYKFGNHVLNRTYQGMFLTNYSTDVDINGNILYDNNDFTILPPLTINIIPCDPSISQPENADAHAAFNNDMWKVTNNMYVEVKEEILSIPLTAVGMADNVNPNWGDWKAIITPTFEAKSLEDYMQSHGWATEAADRWHDPAAIKDSYACHVDGNMLVVEEFRPSCSGTYNLKLTYTPKDCEEGQPAPETRYYPVNPGQWEFDFNVYPDIADLQLGYWNGDEKGNGMFEFSKTDEAANQWTGPGADHAGWKRLNVQPKGGYVDIWWRNHDAPRPAKPMAYSSDDASGKHRAPVDDMELTPEEQGYQKMGPHYIDASNINNLDIMLSKNGAVNPTYATLSLNRDANLQPVGIDAPEISDADEAPEVWFTLDGRAAAVGADGLPALPGIYVTASGRKIIRR